MTLEELILRHALGVGTEPPPREKQAAGVLMLPIRKRGVLEEVRGVEEARRVPLIEDVASMLAPAWAQRRFDLRRRRSAAEREAQ